MQCMFFFTTYIRNGLPAAVFPGRYDLGSFKSGSIPTLRAGNAPVAPQIMVLQGVVLGSVYLPSGDPYDRLPYLFR